MTFHKPENYHGEVANCFWWAVGTTATVGFESAEGNLIPVNGDADSIEEAFCIKVDDMHQKGYLSWDSTCITPFSSLEDIDKAAFTSIFILYGFQDNSEWDPNTENVYFYDDDFHVVRGDIEKDGTIKWYHKFGWRPTPREVTLSDWSKLNKTWKKKVYMAFSPKS